MFRLGLYGFVSVSVLSAFTLAGGVPAVAGGMVDSSATKKEENSHRELSFTADVQPIFRRACLPCHAEDNFNPSELSLDSRELLREGGKHGVPVVPGNADKSILVQKLGPNPPFGDRMPLDPRKKRGVAPTKVLSEEELNTIRAWIEQGAR